MEYSLKNTLETLPLHFRKGYSHRQISHGKSQVYSFTQVNEMPCGKETQRLIQDPIKHLRWKLFCENKKTPSQMFDRVLNKFLRALHPYVKFYYSSTRAFMSLTRVIYQNYGLATCSFLLFSLKNLSKNSPIVSLDIGTFISPVSSITC